MFIFARKPEIIKEICERFLKLYFFILISFESKTKQQNFYLLLGIRLIFPFGIKIKFRLVHYTAKKDPLEINLMGLFGSGDRTRTYDLRVMSPTSYQLLHPAIYLLAILLAYSENLFVKPLFNFNLEAIFISKIKVPSLIGVQIYYLFLCRANKMQKNLA